jgi:hypothetical protein
MLAKDLYTESFPTVHKSLLGIAKMRLSIERAQVQVRRSWNAILDSRRCSSARGLEDFKP